MLKNLNDLAMLISVAESNGFSAAARLHNMSPATLSKQIARIEKELGVRLFKRNTRFLEITEEGKHFVKHVRQALEILNEAETSIKQPNKLSGLLRISAPTSLGIYYIAPLIASFHKLYPELRIDLNLTDHVVDLYSQGVDIAIRIGELPDSTLVAKRLTTNQRILVVSPDYLNKRGNLTQPIELSSHPCLLFSYPGYRQDRWTLTNIKDPGWQESIHINNTLSSDNGAVLKQWCLLGQGIALRETWEVDKELQSGELIHLLPEWQEPSSTISIIYQHRQRTQTKISTFVQYIIENWQH